MTMPLWAYGLPWNVIAKASDINKVPIALLASIVQHESGGSIWTSRFEPSWSYLVTPELYAKNLKTSVETERVHQATSWGLCQVMGSVLRELGFVDHLPMACKPHLNVDFGAKKLAKLMARYSDISDVVASYNAGSPRKTQDGKFENQAYVDDVLRLMREMS